MSPWDMEEIPNEGMLIIITTAVSEIKQLCLFNEYWIIKNDMHTFYLICLEINIYRFYVKFHNCGKKLQVMYFFLATTFF